MPSLTASENGLKVNCSICVGDYILIIIMLPIHNVMTLNEDHRSLMPWGTHAITLQKSQIIKSNPAFVTTVYHSIALYELANIRNSKNSQCIKSNSGTAWF